MNPVSLFHLDPPSLAKTVQCLAQVKVRMERLWNDKDKGKPTAQVKTCPNFYRLRNKSLLKTIPTWTELGSNSDLGYERLATYRLNHGKDSLTVTDKVFYPYRTTIMLHVSKVNHPSLETFIKFYYGLAGLCTRKTWKALKCPIHSHLN